MNETNQKKERRTGALLVLASCVLAVFVCEAILRLAFPTPSGHFIHRPNLVRTFHPIPEVMPGVSGESKFRVNSLGVRGSEPPEKPAYRILTLGGSTTECLYLDQEEAWPRMVEKDLNEFNPENPVWVANAGKTGISSREHRLQLPILLNDIDDIDLVILLTGINDLLLRLAVDDLYDPDFVVKPGSRDFLMNRAFDVVRSATDTHRVPFFPRRFVGLSLELFGSLIGVEGEEAPPHLVEDRAGQLYVQRRLFRRNRIGIREELPDLSTGLREYSNNLVDCIRAAREREVNVVLVSQPVLWRESLPPELEDLLWTGGVGSISGEELEYYSTPALATGMKKYNERLKQLAEEQSVPFFDLATRLPRDDSVFYDDCHFNERGAEMVSETMVEFLIDEPTTGLDD